MKHMLIATILGNTYNWEIDLPEGVPALFIAAGRKGFQEFLQDASSTCKGTSTEKAAACAKRAAAIQSGEYKSGGASVGRSNSLDKDSEALHQWLVKNGFKGKKADLNARLVSMAAGMLATAGLPIAEATAAAASKTPELITKIKATPQWVALRASLDKGESVGNLFGGLTL